MSAGKLLRSTSFVPPAVRDKSVAEYLRVAKEYNVSTNFVLVVDKRALIEYLEGSGEGQGKIDQSKLTLAASAGTSAGSVSAGGARCRGVRDAA